MWSLSKNEQNFRAMFFAMERRATATTTTATHSHNNSHNFDLKLFMCGGGACQLLGLLPRRNAPLYRATRSLHMQEMECYMGQSFLWKAHLTAPPVQ